jgi:hypothetical protein
MHSPAAATSTPEQPRPTGDPRSGPLPDFVVIGAMKAGSTTLWRHLRQHPEVFMTSVKEPHFFVAERNWSRGADWYREQFAAGRGRVRGEASVTYTQAWTYHGVPERMAALVPAAKLVYLVRDPVDRIRSHYLHELAALRETLRIEQAVWAHPKYLDVSGYGSQVERFLAHYPVEQVHVLTSEALFSRPDQTLAELFAFLGVDAGWRTGEAVHVNRSSRKSVPRPIVHRVAESPLARAVVRRMPVPWREVVKEHLPRRPIDGARADLTRDVVLRLHDVLRPEVDKLVRLTGVDVEGWNMS